MQDSELTAHAATIVAAYVSHNAVPATELPALIADVYRALLVLTIREHVQKISVEDFRAMVAKVKDAAPVGSWRVVHDQELWVAPEPAVPVKKSVTPDYVVCLEDGRKFKSMKRHLSNLGMTPAQYREKWSLPADWPIVAPNYAAVRSGLAKKNGLGRKNGSAA